MLWAILISLAVLGIAYLISELADSAVEPRNTFFLVIGVFLVIYIGAAIFVSYRVKAWSAEKTRLLNPFGNGSPSYIYEEPIHPVDLGTNP